MQFLISCLKKIIKSVFFICSALPRKLQYLIGASLGIIWFDVLRIRRRIIFSNLDLAFPDKTKKEKTTIARQSCINLGMTYIEFMRLPFLNKKNLNEFKVFGQEHVDKADSQGKGTCLLTLHMGNGDYACAGYAMFGYPIVLISKVFKIKWINEAWFSMRQRHGNTYFPPERSAYEILKSLKKNKKVIFVMDQFMHPPMGIHTTFFGHKTRSTTGLAVMAHRSRAPVVPIYTYRNKKGQTEIHFFEEIPFIEQASKEESIAHMTQAYQDQLEVFVRKHPDQWMWVHRRWKDY